MSSAGEATPGTTAGALLRAAREKQGLHIAALAAAIKVTPRKLEALERDRYDELPDATFTRALAQTVCRALRVDAAPVLALLPQAEAPSLDHVTGTLNAPFRDRPGREDPAGLAVAAIRPMAWAGLALLVAAVVVYFLPKGVWAPTGAPPAAAVPATAASVAAQAASLPAVAAADAAATASAPETVARTVEAIASSPPVIVASAATTPASAAAMAAPAAALAGSVARAVPTAAPAAVAAASAAPVAAAPTGTLLQLRTSAPSWIEVRDARGTVLLSRIVAPGENLGLDGAVPIRLTIGNAGATQLSFRGKPVDLAGPARDNVARLELQ